MNYFIMDKFVNKNKHNSIYMNRNKKFILNNPNLGKVFSRGDILTLNFWSKTFRYHFEGICLSLNNSSFSNPNISFILRNVLFGIGVEMSVSFFFNRLYLNVFMSDFKRKSFNYRLSKLYYLRLKNNQATRIKS